MAKGDLHPNESRVYSDKKTGARVRQVTDHPSTHHHPFYYLPAYDDELRRLFYVSNRTGRPEVFAEIRESGKLMQLTERAGLNEWSFHPSHDGRFVYYTAGTGAWRMDTESLKEEELANFGDVAMKEKGMVGAAMGTTTLSRDDLWWAIPVKVGSFSRFVVIDTVRGKQEVILERDTIGHPQFHPSNSDLLRYAGPYQDRMWVINRDGTGNRLVYKRDVSKKEWIVHETWMPGRYELLTANWPHGVIGVDVYTGEVRKVCSFNAWHPMVNRQGTLMVCDTNYPDIGLQLFDPRDGIGQPTPLCLSEATNMGIHWKTDHCPYDDGPVEVYAPQHTHPHPNFSPDGRKVVFTSDRTGYAQVYEVDVPA
jgi:oligogalacturonide lyase